jgi:hypothetical protein
MADLAVIPEWDHRADGLPAYVRARRQAANGVMEAVLDGLGFAGMALRPMLPLGDRIAARRLAAMDDPYRDEILALPAVLDRPGAVAFSLSYEWGCTTRVFENGGIPQLFRILDWPFHGLGARIEVVRLSGPAGLDWPFHGLGARIEVVRLSGPAGDWVTATWPGVMGALHGTAPGRFAIALNQAPERQTGFGRPIDWLTSKRRFLRQTGLPPQHLLRQVFEQAPDYATAREMLTETRVAVPVIYTLAGANPGEACVIERTETAAASPTEGPPIAANHFTTPLRNGRWRARGRDSLGRHCAASTLEAAPPVDRLEEPLLNELTRLALTMDATGRLSVTGYEGLAQVTLPCHSAA